MKTAKTGLSRAASLLAEDDGAVDCSVVQANIGLLLLIR